MATSIIAILGKRFPQGLRKKLELKLIHSGSEQDSGTWFAGKIILILLLTLATFLIVFGFTRNSFYGFSSAIFILIAFSTFTYLRLYMAIFERAQRMEHSLPDFLMLISSNLHAGMSPFDSFLKAARPEFGPLYNEVTIAAGKVGGKRSLEYAMQELTMRFDSDMFSKTMELFLRATRSGGNVAKLLEANAEEIRKIQELRSELISTTQQQAILLAFIIVVLMPFLLAIGYSFLTVFVSVQNQVSHLSVGEKMPSLSFFNPQVSITPSDMFYLSIITLITTNFLVSLFIGVIRYGKSIYGLKYFIPMAIVSSAMFLMMLQVLKGVIMGS